MGWKTIVKIILVLIAVFAAAGILYASIGWNDGDPAERLIADYQPEDKQIVSAEYVLAGRDEAGGHFIYKVRTEDGGLYYVRVHVNRFRTLIGGEGPGYKIKGYSIMNPEDYWLTAEISFYTNL